jgi:hypothetical protein
MIVEKPIVALRPSAHPCPEGGIYSVNRDFFDITPANSEKLIEFLNTVNVGKKLGVEEVDSKIFPDLDFKRRFNIKLRNCEKISLHNGVNILGGVFFKFLESFGVEFEEKLSRSRVEDNDSEFICLVYPELADYFKSSETLPDDYKHFAEGVIYNNTGLFSVVEINGRSKDFLEEELRRIALLKRIFRHGVRSFIPWKNCAVRDNVVHTPENVVELASHHVLFKRRRI